MAAAYSHAFARHRSSRSSAWSPGCRRCGAAVAVRPAARRASAAVHDGRERRVDGDYPSEVQPLVDDLNALLEHREQTVSRARSRRPATSRTG